MTLTTQMFMGLSSSIMCWAEATHLLELKHMLKSLPNGGLNSIDSLVQGAYKLYVSM